MPKNVKCKNCNNLNSNGWWCEKVLDSPDTEMLRDCRHFWQKRNIDRIRDMNEEKMGDFLCSIAYARNTPWSEPFERKFCHNCPTVEVTIQETGRTMKLTECDFVDGKCPHGSDIVWWLQQPVEE